MRRDKSAEAPPDTPNFTTTIGWNSAVGQKGVIEILSSAFKLAGSKTS